MKKAAILLTASAVLWLAARPSYALEKIYAAEGEHVEAHDYIGLYLQIPERVQRTIGITTAQAEKSHVRGEVHLNGRVPQDVEDVTDVYVTQRGSLQSCRISLGQRVNAGDTLCAISTANAGELEVSAPADGIIIAQFVKPGDRIDTISPLLRLADYTRIPVTFDVYEKDVGKIRLGQQVRVYSSAYPEEVFEGKITFISPRIDETTFTLKIRALINNPDYLLKPGMFVRGEALLGTDTPHVAVPPYSVQNLDGMDVVFVKDEDESFIPTEVRVAYQDNDLTIVSGEVYKGDAVVVNGAYHLKSKILESEIVGGCAHGH